MLKTPHQLCALGFIILITVDADVKVHGQGSLIPPGPPGPTMKTLSQIEPRTLIDTLPYRILSSGSYYLATNLTGSTGAHGISIEASHVTLDLEGFALTGSTGALNGINLPNPVTNVVMRNGTINLWSGGIAAHTGTNCRFENLHLLDNAKEGLAAGPGSTIESCFASSNQSSGITADAFSSIRNSAARLNAGPGILADSGTRIEGCTATANTGAGITCSNSCLITTCVAANNSAAGIVAGNDVQLDHSKASNNGSSGIIAGADSFIQHCSAAGNFDDGITTDSGARVIDSKATANTRGIVVQSGSTVRDCSALQNNGDGIWVNAQCSVTGNTANANFLARDAAGIHATGADNSLKDNTVVANDWGIRVDVAGNLIIRNAASNNSLNYSIGANPQSMAPVLSGDGLTSASNPLANVEF